MPLYEYECVKDGRFEQIRKFSDPPLSSCPTCGQPVEKLLSSPAIQFKGSGWYVTDYARKSDAGESKSESKKETAPAKDAATPSSATSATSDGSAKPSGAGSSGSSSS